MHLSNHIDFTSATFGGLLIGVSSTALLAALGKVSGASGIVGCATIPCRKSNSLSAWASTHSSSVPYILGLMGSGYVYMSQHSGFAASVGHGEKATAVTALAGLLVGFGSRLGSGCVSGHGVCGLPRLSLRSLVAVATFMLTGTGGAVLGRYLEQALSQPLPGMGHFPAAVVALGVFSSFLAYRAVNRTAAEVKKTDGDRTCSAVVNTPSTYLVDGAVHFICAFTFGWGLCLSGMTSASKVRGFLDFSGPEGWDPSLMGVMAGAVGFNLVSFRALRGWKLTPVCMTLSARPCEALDRTMKYGAVAENLLVTWRLVVGAAIFGIGWGMGGLCPGPSLVQMGASSPLAQVYVPGMLLGMALQEVIFN